MQELKLDEADELLSEGEVEEKQPAEAVGIMKQLLMRNLEEQVARFPWFSYIFNYLMC